MSTLRELLQRLSGHASCLGIQAAHGRHRPVVVRRLYGASSGRLYLHGPRARLGEATDVGPASPVGAALELRSRLRPLLQCHRSTDRGSTLGVITLPSSTAKPLLLYGRRHRPLAARRPALPAKDGLVNHTLYCLFGLLSVSGLRICEALGLTLDDVDLDDRHPDDTLHQVRQVPPGSAASNDRRGLGRLPGSAANNSWSGDKFPIGLSTPTVDVWVTTACFVLSVA